ncbi:MAG: hypothetical protein IT376_00415 [Polyangiaceae bacterium]|nr:hypothetical protein [Polyangiaceae bacterium]
MASASSRPDDARSADDPLEADEVARYRAHFAFLKEHRKLLALKLNAAEDLLLNGVREPTHRGVCQHLLAKVERSRVELVAPRLDPAARARLLEGVLGFAPDMGYLLLYLETLRDARRPDAVAALGEALRSIDFASVSAAQMRRVLELIVELHDAAALPSLLFSLLESATFQQAFDASAERLPPALADIVVPLRAVHAVVVRGERNPTDAAALARGASLLLAAPARLLRARSLAARQRLFDVGLELASEPVEPNHRGLAVLVEGFARDADAHGEASLRLARWLLTRGLEREAKAAIEAAGRVPRLAGVAQAWRRALEAPRVGPVAIADAGVLAPAGRERFTVGWHVGRQRDAWVRVGPASEAARYERAVALTTRLPLPSVAAVLASGRAGAGEAFLAVERHGRPAHEVVLGKTPLPLDELLALVRQAVRLLASLALGGVALPDARLRRFAVDDHGRLWLRDLVEAAEREDAERTALEQARELALDVLARGPRPRVPAAALERLTARTAISDVLSDLDAL